MHPRAASVASPGSLRADDRARAGDGIEDDKLRALLGELVIAFAVTATLLAGIGTYGVMAYVVSLRTREIGIRRALGAGRRDIVFLVGRRALLFVAAGLGAGVATALMLTQLIESQLWGITATDPATFVGVSALLAVIALVAAGIPARRALEVDPAVALKQE